MEGKPGGTEKVPPGFLFVWRGVAEMDFFDALDSVFGCFLSVNRTSNGGCLLTDNNIRIIGKESVLELIRYLEKGYENVTEEDIERWNEKRMRELNGDFITYRPPEKKEVWGHVYFIQSGDLVKIGGTRKQNQRLESLSKVIPGGGKFLFSYETNNLWELERLIHELFSSKRKNGEWFNLSKVDLLRLSSGNLPKSIKGMVIEIITDPR